MTPADEERAISALVALAARLPREERADLIPTVSPAPEDDTEGLRLAHEHGVDAQRLIAYRGLAHSRGVPLSSVLRAAFRGELRDIVNLPEQRS